MELIPHKTLSIHMIDENFLFSDDLKEKYSWKSGFKLITYPSADRFFSEINGKPLLHKGYHVVILAINLSNPDKTLATEVINKCAVLVPGVHIINICHKKALGNGESSLRKKRIIHIINNENALFRIDNAIKWVLARINLDRKKRRYRIVATLFISVLSVTLILFVISLLI